MSFPKTGITKVEYIVGNMAMGYDFIKLEVNGKNINIPVVGSVNVESDKRLLSVLQAVIDGEFDDQDT